MNNLNRVCLMGHLTKDAALMVTADGKSVSNFSIAVNVFNQEDASFFDVVLWNSESRQQYLTKGMLVSIDGYLKQERWKTEDGQKRSRVVVIAQNLYLLGKLSENKEKSDLKSANTCEQDIPHDDEKTNELIF